MAALPHAELTHLGFYVADIARMTDFYTHVMGMVVTDSGEAGGRAWAFLSRNPQEHHQVVLASGRPADSFQLINQISFRVADLDALRAWHAHASSVALPGLEAVTHGNAWSIYFRDPEDNRIEIYASSPWYVSQPMRIAVDMTRSATELIEETDALTRDDPSRRPHAQWVEEMRVRIGEAM